MVFGAECVVWSKCAHNSIPSSSGDRRLPDYAGIPARARLGITLEVKGEPIDAEDNTYTSSL